jgi:hypothetical protein
MTVFLFSDHNGKFCITAYVVDILQADDAENGAATDRIAYAQLKLRRRSLKLIPKEGELQFPGVGKMVLLQVLRCPLIIEPAVPVARSYVLFSQCFQEHVFASKENVTWTDARHSNNPP